MIDWGPIGCTVGLIYPRLAFAFSRIYYIWTSLPQILSLFGLWMAELCRLSECATSRWWDASPWCMVHPFAPTLGAVHIIHKPTPSFPHCERFQVLAKSGPLVLCHLAFPDSMPSEFDYISPAQAWVGLGIEALKEGMIFIFLFFTHLMQPQVGYEERRAWLITSELM